MALGVGIISFKSSILVQFFIPKKNELKSAPMIEFDDKISEEGGRREAKTNFNRTKTNTICNIFVVVQNRLILVNNSTILNAIL